MITIQRISEDKLTRHNWHFDFSKEFFRDEFYLRLNSYFAEERKQPKGRFGKSRIRYERTDQRGNSIAAPPMPDDVIEEVKQLIINKIKTLEVDIR
jgi:hypothetical protein